MRAVTVDRRGRVSIRDVPVPAVGRREVRIAVDTSGVGTWDAEMRPEASAPFVVPGTDGAGAVSAVGSGVRRFRVGDRVYSYSYQNRKGGFHAQEVVVDAKKVARVPRGLDWKQAGALGTTEGTTLKTSAPAGPESASAAIATATKRFIRPGRRRRGGRASAGRPAWAAPARPRRRGGRS